MRNVMRNSRNVQTLRPAWNVVAPRSSERLIGCRQHLGGHEFVEADAAAADMALAAFEGARHARQGVLHDPDVPTVLDCAACLPRRSEPADRPRTPHARIRRSI